MISYFIVSKDISVVGGTRKSLISISDVKLSFRSAFHFHHFERF